MITDKPITQLLDSANQGDNDAQCKIITLVYDELHRMAQSVMAKEKPSHTLQATAIVHEAYLKLFGSSNQNFTNSKQFFAAMGNILREICVDYARKKGALKRGGDRQRVPLDGFSIAGLDQDPAEVLSIHDALSELEAIEPRQAQVVLLRYFNGFTVEECAAALEISPRTVVSDWKLARAWLRRKLFDHEQINDGKS